MVKKTLFAFVLLGLLAGLLVPLASGRSPVSLGLDLAGGAMVVYRPDMDSVARPYADLPREELLALTKEALKGRLRSQFETLPDVVVRDDGSIAVSLPGEHDQRRILETVGQTHRLTFRRVIETHAAEPTAPGGWALAFEGRWLEMGEELLSGENLDLATIRVEEGDRWAGVPQDRGAIVSFEFRPPFDERFAEITRDSVGETLAILLDDRVEWAGVVDEEIRGRGSLRGGYTAEQASEVAGLLRSGSLPVSLQVEEISAVGPTLGQEMLRRGHLALGLTGTLLALLLVVGYAHRPALLLTGIASLGVLLLLTVGLIAALGLTVDLVAIAGLVLSIGMGMDAIILVFESIESGGLPDRGSPLARLRAVYGYRGEGRTLVHANASTLLVVLLLLASERLHSFALFLVVGLAASLATVFFTRWALGVCARKGWLDLPAEGARPRGALGWLRSARPGLFRARHAYAVGLLLFLMAAAGVVGALRPGPWLELGADFRPGMQLQLTLESDADPDALMADLRELAGGGEARYQARESASESRGRSGYLVTLEGADWTRPSSSAGGTETSGETAIANALGLSGLSELLGRHDAQLEGAYSVDARLSARRTLASLGVLLGSLALLALYLGVLERKVDRWMTPRGAPKASASGPWIFAGTVIAIVTDLLITIAALALLEIPIGMPVIAALLTIVGYSVNDSMVLWSRLARPTEGAPDTVAARIRRGVDAVLSRTFLTSLSTVLPAMVILWVGLEPLRGFAWAILVGTVAGTLSSIFIVASFAKPAFAAGPRRAASGSGEERAVPAMR